YRTLIDGMLHKARTGVRWTELPTVYGNRQTIHTRCTQWLKSGLWARIMEEVEAEPGQPLPEPETAVPPLHIRGGIDPRLFAVHELSDPDTAANALEFKAFADDAQVFATD
ncbi:MAG TPA: transposase, partial [Streptomyces sp.]|nr:transposase [Streptomyces sp.]